MVSSFKPKKLDYKVPEVELPYGSVDEIVLEALNEFEHPKKKPKASADTDKTDVVENSSRNTSLEDDTLEEVAAKPITRSTRASSRKAGKTSEEICKEDSKSDDKPATKVKRKRGRPPKSNTSEDSIIITSERKAKLKQHDFTTASWLKERNILILPEEQRPKPDLEDTLSPILHNYTHWNQIESDLRSCLNNYERMATCAQCHVTGMDGSDDKVETFFGKRLTWDKQDTLAHSLFPRDGPYDRSLAFEITTGAVGDCFLDAISRLTFGNQNHSRELRTRMTLEGLAFEEWYLSHENLAIKLPLLTTTHSLPQRYALYSGTSSSDYNHVYREEIKRCFKDGQYCALWQIHQMATVIGRPITSIFPEFDDVEDEAPLRYYHNRIIYPRREEDRCNETAVIMWTKSSPFSDELANHIVPVVK